MEWAADFILLCGINIRSPEYSKSPFLSLDREIEYFRLLVRIYFLSVTVFLTLGSVHVIQAVLKDWLVKLSSQQGLNIWLNIVRARIYSFCLPYNRRYSSVGYDVGKQEASRSILVSGTFLNEDLL